MEGLIGTDDPFLAACQGRKARYTPVWFMRQAGRALPEYRAIKGSLSIMDAVRDPELAAEITLQPVRRYGVDAAILFSDIMVPVAATGFGVEIAAGTGPVTEYPFRDESDLDRLRPVEPGEDTPWIGDTIRILIKELQVPLIGFAGGPFTLASYIVDGRPTRDHAATKVLMHSNPRLWRSLLERLVDLSVAALRDQVHAGAHAVQVFDSWAGALSPDDYERCVLPSSTRLFREISDLGVPMIHFGVGTGEILSLMAAAGADVIGVDWRVPLDSAALRVPSVQALQGNLDPGVCLGPWAEVAREASSVLRRAPSDRGHIFNLGHGVLPQTDPGVLTELTAFVHDQTTIH